MTCHTPKYSADLTGGQMTLSSGNELATETVINVMPLICSRPTTNENLEYCGAAYEQSRDDSVAYLVET